MDPILSHESRPHSRPHCHTNHFNKKSTITHCLQRSEQHSASMVSSLPWVQHSCPSHSSPDYLTKHYEHQILRSMGFFTIVFFMILFVSHRSVLKHPEHNSFPHGQRPWFERLKHGTIGVQRVLLTSFHGESKTSSAIHWWRIQSRGRILRGFYIALVANKIGLNSLMEHWPQKTCLLSG
jgi:hypothetical protein